MKSRKELLDEIHNLAVQQQVEKKNKEKSQREGVVAKVDEYKEKLVKALVPQNKDRVAEFVGSTDTEREALREIANALWGLGYNTYFSTISVSSNGKAENSVKLVVSW